MVVVAVVPLIQHSAYCITVLATKNLGCHLICIYVIASVVSFYSVRCINLGSGVSKTVQVDQSE